MSRTPPAATAHDPAAVIAPALVQIFVEAVRAAQPQIERYLRDEIADLVQQALADMRLRDP
jgi:hypothetical protein